MRFRAWGEERFISAAASVAFPEVYVDARGFPREGLALNKRFQIFQSWARQVKIHPRHPPCCRCEVAPSLTNEEFLHFLSST